MKFKIFSCVIILVLIIVFRPNFDFIQKAEIKKSRHNIVENKTNAQQYRTQPKKYFAIMREKQASINNLYMSYYMDNKKTILDEIYIKDGMQKQTSYLKNNNDYKEIMTILKRGRKTYAYQKDKNSPIKFAMDMTNTEGFEVDSLLFPAKIVPKKDLNNYKFLSKTNYKGRSCALWQNIHYNKNTKSTDTSNLCIDEELGIVLYQNVYFASKKRADIIMETKEIRVSPIKDNEFYIPKHIKGTINGKFSAFFGQIFLKETYLYSAT